MQEWRAGGARDNWDGQYAGTEQRCEACQAPGMVGEDLEVFRHPTRHGQDAEEPGQVTFRCRDREGCRRRVQAAM